MEQRSAGEVLEARVREVVVVADSADRRVGEEAWDDRVVLSRNGRSPGEITDASGSGIDARCSVAMKSEALRPPDPLLRGVGDRRGHLQAAGVGVPRRGRHLLRLPDLDDLTAVEHRDAVADLVDDAEVVADEQVRDAGVLLELLEEA